MAPDLQAQLVSASQMPLASPSIPSYALKPYLIGSHQSPSTASMRCDFSSATCQLVERTLNLLAKPLATLTEALGSKAGPLCQLVAEASQSPGLPALSRFLCSCVAESGRAGPEVELNRDGLTSRCFLLTVHFPVPNPAPRQSLTCSLIPPACPHTLHPWE